MRFILGSLPKFIIAALLLGVVSCGPVEYMGQVGVKASKSHAGLKQAHGEKYSPYEYWSSKYYLERARYKAGYGDYQDSVRYGKKSQAMCQDGKRNSLRAKRREVEIGKSEAEAKAAAKDEPEEKPVKIKLNIEKKGESK